MTICAIATRAGVRRRARRMPTGSRIALNLRRRFAAQRDALLAIIRRETKSSKTAARAFVEIERWLTANAPRELQLMLWANRPVIELLAADEGRAVLGRVGASDEVFDVRAPHIHQAIDQLTLRFGRATNAMTSRQVRRAVTDLREEIRQGLDEGESIRQLTDRVQQIFESASDFRAGRIARTEASRAVHLGQQLGAEQSRLVVGKRWIASTDGCPLCMELDGKTVALDEEFRHNPMPGPYSEMPFPPAHPHCRCDMIEVLRD